MVIPEQTDRFFGDPFFASIVAGIGEVIGESDYIMNMLIASDDASAKALGYLRGGSVDGAIVASHHTSDTFLDRVADVVPVVYGGRPARVRADDYYVDVDNVEGGRVATAYLLARGHRRIATVSGPDDMPAGIDRLQGFRDAMAEAGVEPVAVENGDFTEMGGALAMTRVLASGERPDAVFVASDLMARGAYTVLREKGLEPGRDIAVMGFDDSAVSTALSPALTTVRQPSLTQGGTWHPFCSTSSPGVPRPTPRSCPPRSSSAAPPDHSHRAVSGSMPCARALASIASRSQAASPGRMPS